MDEMKAGVNASFYITGSDKSQAADSVTIYGIGIDTVKLYDKSRTSVIKLPLNNSAESCSFMIRVNGVSDTITFHYTSFPYLVSKECGFTFYNNIESVHSTKNIIDTIIVRYSTVTTGNEENMRIFF